MERAKRYIRCLAYLIGIGIISFAAGRSLPQKWITPDKFPFCSFAFERGGKLYDKLKIKKWKDKLPDMSRLCRRIMPAKRCAGRRQSLPVLIRETCIAEWSHLKLILAGFYCKKIVPDITGHIISLVYAVGNLPFIMVQRYNRPRLIRSAARAGHET